MEEVIEAALYGRPCNAGKAGFPATFTKISRTLQGFFVLVNDWCLNLK